MWWHDPDHRDGYLHRMSERLVVDPLIKAFGFRDKKHRVHLVECGMKHGSYWIEVDGFVVSIEKECDLSTDYYQAIRDAIEKNGMSIVSEYP